jgi:hypothetical protein
MREHLPLTRLGRALSLLVVPGLIVLLLPASKVDGYSRQTGVRITGPEQIVFDWRTSQCSPDDYPDLPVRAFRDADGQVQLIFSHYINRRMVGPSLDALTHPCDVVMASNNDPNPANFNDREWLAAVHTSDGRTVLALVHDEYHGESDPACRPRANYLKCWYNAITFAVSTDGGRTFLQPPAPHNLVAALPDRFAANAGPAGIFEPSNIVYNRRDGYFYVAARIVGYGNKPRGTCIMRTPRLGDVSSWRGWNGSSFSVRFVNPYLDRVKKRRSEYVCQPVATNEIGAMSQSLTFSTYFGKFLLVGTAVDRESQRKAPVWGVYYSLSDDLVHWTRRKLVMEAELTWTFHCGDKNPILYPSVIDPESPSRTFALTGRTAYLYFTRLNYHNCRQGQDRDLIRVPLEFSK